MIRWNPKTGRWSDELPSRLCSWLDQNQVGGGPLPPPVFTFLGQASNDTATTALVVTASAGAPVGSELFFGHCYHTDQFTNSTAPGWTDSRGHTYAERSWQTINAGTTDHHYWSATCTTAIQSGDTFNVSYNSPGPTGRSGFWWAVTRVNYAASIEAGFNPQFNTATPSQAMGASATQYGVYIAGFCFNAGSTTTITPPSGWTQIGTTVNFWSNGRSVAWYYRITSDQGSYTFAPSLSASRTGCINSGRYKTYN